MGYLGIYLISFFCAISLLSSGKLFNKFLIKDKNINFFENIILGFILLSFLSVFINFFFSLNEKLNLVFLIFPLILYFFINKREIKKDFKYLLLISFLSVLIISLDNTNRPDAGLYHLPYINILNESNLIVGISNIHFRYGHISIIQYISAIYNNIFFSNNGILVPPSIIFLALIVYLILESIKSKDYQFYNFFSILFTSYTLINMNRYSSWGNDDFATIIMFIVFLNCYKNFKNFKNTSFAKTVLFCSLTFLIKSFYLLIFLLPLVILIKNFKIHYKKIFFNKINLFNFIFLSLWFIKNFLTSSCLIFPISFLCYDAFSWSLNQISINNISLISEAWAKDWPNNNENLGYQDYVSNFNWINVWINNHFLIVIKNLTVLIVLIVIFKISYRMKLDNLQMKFINIYSLILFALSLIWFLKFPLLRYGEGILVTFLLIITMYIKTPIITVNSYKVSLVIILILSIGVIGKNLSRILKNYNNVYVDYPWPKKNTYTNSNTKNEYVPYKVNDEVLYYRPKIEANLCMYGSSPCAAIGVNETYFKIKDIQINKGKFLIFKMFYIINKN